MLETIGSEWRPITYIEEEQERDRESLDSSYACEIVSHEHVSW